MMPSHNRMPSQKSEIEKADVLGERLVGGAGEVVAFIIEQLRTRFGVGLRDISSAPQITIEVIVFYMHLVDRLALAHLGVEKREAFVDRFIVAVVKEVSRELAKQVSADDFVPALRETYNLRQVQYARYRMLMPSEREALKNTLFWEFSNVLFGFFDDHNPVTLALLNVMVIDLAEVMLKDAMKVDEVLLG